MMNEHISLNNDELRVELISQSEIHSLPQLLHSCQSQHEHERKSVLRFIKWN